MKNWNERVQEDSEEGFPSAVRCNTALPGQIPVFRTVTHSSTMFPLMINPNLP